MNMRVDIACQPSYSLAYVHLDGGESVLCESGAMVAMSAGMRVAVSTAGGVTGAVLRKVAGQETFFMARFEAMVHGAWVALAPKFPGDIADVEVTDQHPLLVQTGSLLAHPDTVKTDVKFGGVGTVLQREGLTVLLARGAGKVLICSYGGLQRFDLGEGERLIVDTGHLVAWSANMGLKIGPLSGVVEAAFSGEGLVAELTGPGMVFLQTRAERALRSWLLPPREQNAG